MKKKKYKYLAEQINHYEYLEIREKDTRRFRYDLRSHMELISNLVEKKEYDGLTKYLKSMDAKIATFGNVVTVQNGIVDAIINQCYAKAKKEGIRMEVKGRFPEDCAIEAYDLCTIFSNVLNNALEAAVKTEEKFVAVTCKYTDTDILLEVKNSCIHKTFEKGILKTSKENPEYHGFGLENVKESIEKYDGLLSIELEEGLFVLRVIFQRNCV